MKLRFFAVIFLVCVLSVNGFGLKHEDSRNWKFDVKAVSQFRFETLRGDISVKSHGGNEIVVKVISMSDDRIDLKKEFFSVDVKSGTVIISPYKAAQSAKVAFDITIEVPENLENVEVITESGEIKARGAFKHTIFKAVTGEIDMRGSFTAGNFSSSNGDIELYVNGKLKGPITAESHNGSILIELKSGSGFKIAGETVTGSFRSEFSLKIKQAVAGTTFTGTVNDGPHDIRLKSVNGDIKLLRQ